MESIYLHIGLHKTGSTSLQHFLHNSQVFLESEGYGFPSTSVKSHSQLANQILIKENIHHSAWNDLYTALKTPNFRKLILSSEAFSKIHKPKHFEQLIEKLHKISQNIFIIVYVRPQHERIESMYTQLIKNGHFTGTIMDYLALTTHKFNLFHFLESWKKYFGKENIIVRLTSSSNPKALFSDFMQCLDIHKQHENKDTHQVNKKPRLTALRVLYFINKSHAIRKGKYGSGLHDFRNEFKELKTAILNSHLNKTGPSHYRLLPYSKALELTRYYEESNNAVAKEYFQNKENLFETLTQPYEHSSIEMTPEDWESFRDLLRDSTYRDIILPLLDFNDQAKILNTENP